MELPKPFLDSIENNLPKEEVSGFLASLSDKSPVSIRINPRKCSIIPSLRNIPWNKNGFYLDKKPLFVADPFWHAGAYYVQEASSMIMGDIVRQLRSRFDESVVTLDLCAAPGGKSLDIISNLEEEDLLLSNEVIKSRSSILYENVVKWGYPNHLVSNNDPREFTALKGLFDIVVVDAPCSGEGLFRKDNSAISEWSPENVNLCSQRQERIIDDIWPSLKEGGILIYSTCTFNRQENENILEWISDSKEVENVAVDLESFSGITKRSVGDFRIYKAYPHKVEGEGFSFFILRKISSQDSMKQNKNIKKKDTLSYSSNELVQLSGSFIQKEDEIFFQTHPEVTRLLSTHLRMVKSGVRIGAIKKKGKLVPDQELAMSVVVNPKRFESIDLNYEDSIKYLRKQTFDLDGSQGITFLTFQDINLGFINHLGNRFNNLYPSNWRIRTEQTLSNPQII